MNKNVMIPLSLLDQAIDVMEYIDVTEYGSPITMMYDDVLSALRKKKRSLHLRQTYANIIFAESEDARFDARMKYLQEKRDIAEY